MPMVRVSNGGTLTPHTVSMSSNSASFNVGTGYVLGETLIIGQVTSFSADNKGQSAGSATMTYSYNSSTGILSVSASNGVGYNGFSMTFVYYTR